MTDLVERLRDADTTRRIGESYADTHERRQRDRNEGADTIATLRAEVETVGAMHRDACELAKHRMQEVERLNRELDDVWDALVIQREDNASFGDAFKRQAAEIERLRAALDTVRASGLLIGSTTLHDRVRSAVYNAIDANPAALKEAP